MSIVPAELDYNDIALRKKAKEVARTLYPQLTEDPEIESGGYFDPGKIVLPDNIERLTEEEFYEALTESILQDKLFVIREQRNRFLAATDCYMTSDYPHTSEESKQKWIDYRQQLRDLTSQDLTSVTISPDLKIQGLTWPTIPQ